MLISGGRLSIQFSSFLFVLLRGLFVFFVVMLSWLFLVNCCFFLLFYFILLLVFVYFLSDWLFVLLFFCFYFSCSCFLMLLCVLPWQDCYKSLFLSVPESTFLLFQVVWSVLEFGCSVWPVGIHLMCLLNKKMNLDMSSVILNSLDMSVCKVFSMTVFLN